MNRRRRKMKNEEEKKKNNRLGLQQVYSTSVAMPLTAVVSVFLFGFHLSLAFFLGSTIVSVSVYLHSVGKAQR